MWFSSVQRLKVWVVYHQVFLLRGVKLTVPSLCWSTRSAGTRWGRKIRTGPNSFWIKNPISGEKKHVFHPCISVWWSFLMAGKCWVIKISIPVNSTSAKSRWSKSKKKLFTIFFVTSTLSADELNLFSRFEYILKISDFKLNMMTWEKIFMKTNKNWIAARLFFSRRARNKVKYKALNFESFYRN